jgi:hypothetical protein
MTWNIFKKKKDDGTVDLARFDLVYNFSIRINNSGLMDLCSIGSFQKEVIDSKISVAPIKITSYLGCPNPSLYNLFKVYDTSFRSQVVICADSQQSSRPSVEYRLKDCSVLRYSSSINKMIGGFVMEYMDILPVDFELVVKDMV